MAKRKRRAAKSPAAKSVELLDLDVGSFVRMLRKTYSAQRGLPADRQAMLSRACVHSLMFVLMVRKRGTACTVAFPPPVKKAVWNDSMRNYEQDSLSTLLLQTAARAAFLRKPGLKPFWTDACKGASEHLWLPTVSDCAALSSASTSTTSRAESFMRATTRPLPPQNPNSEGYATTFSRVAEISAVGRWDDDAADDDDTDAEAADAGQGSGQADAGESTSKVDPKVQKCHMFRLYPTSEQRNTLKRWFGVSRYVYNRAVAEVERNGLTSWMSLQRKLVYHKRNYCASCSEFSCAATHCGKPSDGTPYCIVCHEQTEHCDKTDFTHLIYDRAREIRGDHSSRAPCSYCQSCHVFFTGERHCGARATQRINTRLKDWEVQVPAHIRETAVRSALSAFRMCFTNLRNGNTDKFSVSFKSRKRLVSDSIGFSRKSVTRNDTGVTIFRTMLAGTLRVGKRQRRKLAECDMDQDTKLHYNFKTGAVWLVVPYKADKTPCSGSDKIIALDPGATVFMTGYSPDGTLTEYQIPKTTIKSLEARIAHLQSNKIASRRLRKYRTRIRNLVTNAHWQIANELTRTYDAIVLPSFDTQQMVKGSYMHGLNRSLNRNAHYQFKQKLEHKCCERNVRLVICTEEYTSKSCGVCGDHENTRYSGRNQRTFHCDACGIVSHRDFHAARNILIKNMV